MGSRTLLFAIFVLLEIALFIEFGRETSTAHVLGEIVVSAFVGWLIIHSATSQTGIRARVAVWNMQLPGRELLKGFMTLIGGMLLILPGFISDIVGIILILPPTQALAFEHFKKYFPVIFRKQQ